MGNGLHVGKSIKDIAATVISEHRTLAKICWFPLALLCIAIFVIRYGKTGMEVMNPSNVMAIGMKAFIGSIIMVGIYRYLLSDPRFHISTFLFRRNDEEAEPFIAKLYFFQDSMVSAFTSYFIILQLVYEHVNRLIVSSIMNEGNAISYILFGVTPSFSVMAPLYLWHLFFFSALSQLCLVYPYIATAKDVKLQGLLKGILENIKVPTGKRVQIWAVHMIILLPSLYWLTDMKFLIPYEIRSYVASLVPPAIGFIMLVALTIFSAEVFKSTRTANREIQLSNN